MGNEQIKIKTPEEIDILRQAAKILSSILKEITRSLTSGITTKKIDTLAEKLIAEHNVVAAFKGYRGFPSSMCISLNEEVVHGIPDPKRVIKDGDIVSLDIGIIYKGYYADQALTVGVGTIQPELKNLIAVTREALYKGIAQAKVGNHLSDISAAVQQYAEAQKFSVVRDFVGHGIGSHLHEPPEIPNFGVAHSGPVLKEGMVFCIEPMINMGDWQVKVKDDGWTVQTMDGSPSAHFEHMVVVTRSGPLVLTEE